MPEAVSFRDGHGGAATSTATEPIVQRPVTVGTRKKHDKQSMEYILRTGIAGGFAGCAVCLPPPPPPVQSSIAH